MRRVDSILARSQPGMCSLYITWKSSTEPTPHQPVFNLPHIIELFLLLNFCNSQLFKNRFPFKRAHQVNPPHNQALSHIFSISPLFCIISFNFF